MPSDPSFEEMKKLVCDQNVRPPLKLSWNKSWAPVLALMREGWSGNPKVRPTAHKIKKQLGKHEQRLARGLAPPTSCARLTPSEDFSGDQQHWNDAGFFAS